MVFTRENRENDEAGTDAHGAGDLPLLHGVLADLRKLFYHLVCGNIKRQSSMLYPVVWVGDERILLWDACTGKD